MALTTNFPQPPGRKNRDTKSFPNDLVQGSREFYTSINMVDYDFSQTLSSFGAVTSAGGYRLPIPRRLNDNETILWEEWSATNQVGGAALGLASNYVGKFGSALVSGLQLATEGGQIYSGQAINPFMFMMFRRPGFKEFTLQWALAPNTQQESDTINDIIKDFKKAALPSAGAVFGLQKYPKIAMVSFKPEKYLFKLKPCAIISVQVDYTGGGMPSFFKSGAPTIVNLTLNLKEIQLWKSEDIN